MKKCCPFCFSDENIKELVFSDDGCSREEYDIGKCDICGAEGVRLYELSPDSELSYQFGKLFDVFVPESFEEQAEHLSSPKALFEAFTDTWDVFSASVSSSGFECFTRELFSGEMRIIQMLSENVVKARPNGMGENGPFFGRRTWDDFAEEIKHEHRYTASVEGIDSLRRIFRALGKSIAPGSVWYRARIWNNEEGANEADLYEPPVKLASEGRMSPRGVACLYVAESPDTAIFEIRAAVHDEVAVARLEASRELRIVDLSQIDEISPFLPDVDCSLLAINMPDLRLIKRDLVKPMRSSDNPVEYVPTQFIADLVKGMGFDGIGYSSVMATSKQGSGYNIAFFGSSKELFRTNEITRYSIRGIEYTIEQMGRMC